MIILTPLKKALASLDKALDQSVFSEAKILLASLEQKLDSTNH